MALQLFDWPFFITLFAADIAGVCARRIGTFLSRRPEEFPAWANTVIGEISLRVISVPFAFADTILLISGFFMLPWYTVAVCGAAALVAMILSWNLFLSKVVARYGLFVTNLFCYPVAVFAAIWCFKEEYLIWPDLVSWFAIVVVLCSRLVNTFYVIQQNR
jgi:hypothetical protein